MIIINFLNYRKERLRIIDIPSRIAIPFYLKEAKEANIKIILNKKNISIMAATKFTAIYLNNEGKIIKKEIPGMNTYKIAEKFANMLNDTEETTLVCVIESWKLYPNKDEKTKK